MKSSPETKRPSVLLRWTFPCILSFFIVEFIRRSTEFCDLLNAFNASNKQSQLTQTQSVTLTNLSIQRAPPLWLPFYQIDVLGQTSFLSKNRCDFGEILAQRMI